MVAMSLDIEGTLSDKVMRHHVASEANVPRDALDRVLDALTPHVAAALREQYAAGLIVEADALRAEVAHWKDHADDAGRGFAQVCRDYARVSARNVRLAEGMQSLADEWNLTEFPDERTAMIMRADLWRRIESLHDRITPPTTADTERAES
jgi:hypothetical protein